MSGINPDNIVLVPGWTIEQVVSAKKKIKVVISLDREVAGDAAPNICKGLDSLQNLDIPTQIGIYADNAEDVSLEMSVVAEPEDDEDDEDEDDEAEFLEV